MKGKPLEHHSDVMIETVDVDGVYQEEKRNKKERRRYPSSKVLFERRLTKDRRYKSGIDIKI